MGFRSNEATQAFVSSVGNLASGLGEAITSASRSTHFHFQEERRLKFVRDAVAANTPSAGSTEDHKATFDELADLLRVRDGLNKPLARRVAALVVSNASNGWGDATFKSFVTEQALKSEERLLSTNVDVDMVKEAFVPTRLQSAVTQARDAFMGLVYQPELNDPEYQIGFDFLLKSVDPEGKNPDKAAKLVAVLIGREKHEDAVFGYAVTSDQEALDRVFQTLASSESVASFLPDDLSLIAKTTDGQRFAFMPSVMDKLAYTPTANDDENPVYDLYFDIATVAIQRDGYSKADATALAALDVAKVVERDSIAPLEAVKLIVNDRVPTRDVSRNTGMVPIGL